MQTFPAQVKTGEQELDVVITIDAGRVAIDAGREALGSWKAKDCTFERTAPTAYRFHTDREWVTLRVPDDSGFRQALDVLRTEQVPLVPRPLLWVGGVAIASAIVFTSLTTGEHPAEAHPDTEPAAPAAVETPTTTAPPSPTSDEPRVTADELVARWNELATRTPLGLAGPGETSLRGDHLVSVDDRGITVTASPSGDPRQAEEIMATLGLAIGAISPDLEPAERAAVLADLGIRVQGTNAVPLETTTVRNGIEYQLSYEPGRHLMFSAGLEW